jgi:hypothetical protein
MKSVQWQRRPSLRGSANFGLRIAVIAVFVLLSTIFFIPSPVQAQPNIFPASLPEAQEDVSYTVTLVAAPLTCPCTWTITSGSLPPGLNLNAATGTISGTPTATGTYTFFVTVTDTVGTSPQQGFFIIVNSSPITFDTTSLPRAEEGDDYYERIRVSGGKSPYTWSVSSGTLPSGLVLESEESDSTVISGTPEYGTAGTHSFTIRVTDSSSPQLSAQHTFSIVIREGAYESIITIGPSLLAGETDVFVGGDLEAVLEGGESISLNFDPNTSQTITVDPTVQNPTDPDVRFEAEVDRIVVSELSPDAYFDYYAEYFIEFGTNPPQVAQLTGSGWYKEGYQLKTSAPAEIDDTPGTQYRFSHWMLPTGETSRNQDLSLTVSMPGDIIANYDTYYLLTLTSPYGEPTDSTWFKAGSEARWAIEPQKVPMSGILGFFGGTLQAINPSGTTIMNGPKTIAVDWDPDYTKPAILISLLVVVIGLVAYALYRRRPFARPEPVPVGMTPPSLPSPQTTVVMIGDASKRPPWSTREQLLQTLGDLLEKYEEEIKSSVETGKQRQLRKGEGLDEDRMLPPSPTPDAQDTGKPQGSLCSFTAKKLLRTAVSSWRQTEVKNITLPPADKKAGEARPGFQITWTRDVYNEWEILTCSLPWGHKGTHEGSRQLGYSVLNTITERIVYNREEELTPPTPHFTDGMPEVEIDADEVIPPQQLPSETLS